MPNAKRLHFYHGLVPFLGEIPTEMEPSWKGSKWCSTGAKSSTHCFMYRWHCCFLWRKRKLWSTHVTYQYYSHRCSNLKSKFTKGTRKEHNNHNCRGHNREGQSIKGPFKCSLNNDLHRSRGKHVTWKGSILKGNYIFQPSIFRGHVGFQKGILVVVHFQSSWMSRGCCNKSTVTCISWFVGQAWLCYISYQLVYWRKSWVYLTGWCEPPSPCCSFVR